MRPGLTRGAAPAALVALAAAAAGAGCTGDNGGGSPGAGRPASGSVSAAGGQALVDAQAEFARCLREHGVDMPGPSAQRGFEFDPRAAGVSEDAMRAAEAKCDRERRAIADAAPKLSDADRRAAVDAGVRYARCMREHGQDVPDPSLADEGGGTAIEVPADAKENPAFQRATRSCEDVLRENGLP
jgi:hypothetical protein